VGHAFPARRRACPLGGEPSQRPRSDPAFAEACHHFGRIFEPARELLARVRSFFAAVR